MESKGIKIACNISTLVVVLGITLALMAANIYTLALAIGITIVGAVGCIGFGYLSETPQPNPKNDALQTRKSLEYTFNDFLKEIRQTPEELRLEYAQSDYKSIWLDVVYIMYKERAAGRLVQPKKEITRLIRNRDKSGRIS